MYQVRNKVYSEPGYILVGKNKKGYQFEGQPSNFTEEQITFDNMQIDREFVIYSGISNMSERTSTMQNSRKIRFNAGWQIKDSIDWNKYQY